MTSRRRRPARTHRVPLRSAAPAWDMRGRSTPRSIPRSIPRAVAASALAAAVVAPALPVHADDCVEHTAAFPAGHWSARGVSFVRDISDGVSAGFLEGELAFDLDVGTDGSVTGAYTGVLTGQLEGLSDLSSAGAVIVQHGDIDGTAVYARVVGTSDFDIDASIDVSGADGIDIMTGGSVLFEHEAEFTQPFATDIIASFANCGEAIGNLSGSADAPAIFIAIRTGDTATGPDLTQRTVDLLEAIEELDGADLTDPDRFAELILQGELIDASIAAQQSCTTEDARIVEPSGNLRDLLRLALLDNLYDFAVRAGHGDYSTEAVIAVYNAAVRGAMLAGPAGACVTDDGDRTNVTDAFERALMDRWEIALATDNVHDLDLIEAFAAQYRTTQLLDLIGAP